MVQPPKILRIGVLERTPCALRPVVTVKTSQSQALTDILQDYHVIMWTTEGAVSVGDITASGGLRFDVIQFSVTRTQTKPGTHSQLSWRLTFIPLTWANVPMRMYGPCIFLSACGRLPLLPVKRYLSTESFKLLFTPN